MDIIATETAGQDPQPRGGRDTRQRLIDAALEVFADRGYHATSVSEVAARAGLTTGAVYSAFGSKKALLVAAVTQSSSDGADVATILAAAPSLREGLEQVVLETARSGLNPASLRLLKLQMELLKLGLNEPEVLSAVAAVGRQQLAAIERTIAELARRQRVRLPMSAHDLTTLLSAMLNGLELMQLVDSSVVDEQLFLTGLHALLGLDG